MRCCWDSCWLWRCKGDVWYLGVKVMCGDVWYAVTHTLPGVLYTLVPSTQDAFWNVVDCSVQHSVGLSGDVCQCWAGGRPCGCHCGCSGSHCCTPRYTLGHLHRRITHSSFCVYLLLFFLVLVRLFHVATGRVMYSVLWCGVSVRMIPCLKASAGHAPMRACVQRYKDSK